MIHNTLYICNTCGNVFERPKKLLGHGWTPRDGDCPNEYVCPQCESDNYENADSCVECEGVFKESDLQYGLCRECLNDKAKEYAAEYVMNDPDVRDGFAWWLQGKRAKERRDAARSKA